MDLNICLLAGHMTRDIELRFLQSGKAVGSFGLAVNRRWTSEAGEKKEQVSFFDCTAFGRTAEVISEYLKKGSPIMVETRATQETWEDKSTGKPRYAIKFIVERLHFLPTGKKAADGEGATPRRAAAPADGGPSAGAPPPVDDGDNIPF